MHIDKDKVKEYMIDAYGVTVFITALLMTVIGLALAIMSILYIRDYQLIQSIVSVLVAGVLIAYSIVLMRQIQ